MDENGKRNETDGKTEYESNAARRIRLTEKGQESAGAEEPLEINKAANFWYHNKVKILLAAAFAVILLIGVIQFAGRANPDVAILYAGPGYITANENQSICRAMEKLIPDLNGDKKTYVQLNDMVFLTDAQLAERNAEHQENDEAFALNPLENKQVSDRFMSEIFSGSTALCILSEDQYRIVAEAEGFVKLADLFGEEIPDGAIDGYGVRLGETKFGKFYETARIFPEDTVIALRTLPTASVLTGRKKAEKIHANAEVLFREILAYEYPEGYAEPTA